MNGTNQGVIDRCDCGQILDDSNRHPEWLSGVCRDCGDVMGAQADGAMARQLEQERNPRRIVRGRSW